VLIRTNDMCCTKQFSFEAALEKTSVTDMMEMVWKTVPCSRSSMREATLSKLGSAPQLYYVTGKWLRISCLSKRATENSTLRRQQQRNMISTQRTGERDTLARFAL